MFSLRQNVWEVVVDFPIHCRHFSLHVCWYRAQCLCVCTIIPSAAIVWLCVLCQCHGGYLAVSTLINALVVPCSDRTIAVQVMR